MSKAFERFSEFVIAHPHSYLGQAIGLLSAVATFIVLGLGDGPYQRNLHNLHFDGVVSFLLYLIVFIYGWMSWWRVHLMTLGLIHVSDIPEEHVKLRLSWIGLSAGFSVGVAMMPAVTKGMILAPIILQLLLFAVGIALGYVQFYYERHTRWVRWGELFRSSPEDAANERKRVALERELFNTEFDVKKKKEMADKEATLKSLKEEDAKMDSVLNPDSTVDDTTLGTVGERIRKVDEEMKQSIADLKKGDMDEEELELLEAAIRAKYADKKHDIISES